MGSRDEHPRVGGRRTAALSAVLLGVIVVTLDISLTSTALPAIARGLGSDSAGTIWIVNVYYLSVVAALLPMAALGEIHGHRRVFFVGLSVFVMGAAACGVAGSLPALAAARGAVGFGAAAVSATTPALIRTLYTPSRLGRGLGVYALAAGVAFSAGPTVASALLAVATWPWLFVANVPLALLAIYLAGRDLPETERNIRPFDMLSAALCASLFASLLYAVAGVAHRTPWQTIVVALATSIACGCALVSREGKQAAPILAIDLFKIPLFALSSATSVCAFTAQGLVFIVLPFLFQTRFGFTQVEVGFLITPWPAALAAMTIVAAPLGDRVSPSVLGSVGLAVAAAGLASLASLPPVPTVGGIAWRLVLSGVGFGLFQSPNMRALMASAPLDRSGGAGGILAASRLVGQSLGAAVVAVCLTLFPQTGAETSLWFGAAMSILGSLVSLSRLLVASGEGRGS